MNVPHLFWPPLWESLAASLALTFAVLFLWSRWRRFDRSRSATWYLRGFQYLLSGDPDGAIEVVTKVASSGALEAYFTLGALYRRKGELERAIQLHRNLLRSPGLDLATRRAALGELGRDYRQGALWTESAAALEQACAPDGADTPVAPALREELRDVYLAAGRLADAARCQEALGAAGHDRLGAHLWSEAAGACLAAGDAEGAAAATEAAIRACPDSGHALLTRAAVRAAAGDGRAAREDALAAAEAEPWAAGLVFDWLAAAPGMTGEGLREALDTWLGRHPGEPRASLARARLLRAEGKNGEASGALREILVRAPAFLEARRELGRLVLEAGIEGELRQQYRELLASLGADSAIGRCARCRQPARELRWRCPACGAWDWLSAGAPPGTPAEDLTL